MKISIHPPIAIHELGRRENQEDDIFVGERLFVLCDGMGGHERGEVASGAVCQGVAEYFEQHICHDDTLADEALKGAIDHAYQRLDACSDDSTVLSRRMGTTMTMLCLHAGGVTAAHIGDSRIYHLRPSTRNILYMSRDHSLVFELYQLGEISKDDMRTHPNRNHVSRAMIPGADQRQVADLVHIADVQPGDYFVLCSDGMLEHLTDDELLALLATDASDEVKKQQLTNLTSQNDDNHSAIIIHIAEVTTQEGDDALADDEQTVRWNAMNIHPVMAHHKDDDDEAVVVEVRAVTPPPTQEPSRERRNWLSALKNLFNL